jgi:hypothetical protein
VLRTYALWNSNRIVLVAMLSALFVSSILSTHPVLWLMNQPGYHCIVHRHLFQCYRYLSWSVLSLFPLLFARIHSTSVTTSVVPGITGCYRSSTSVQFFMPFLLLLVFQLGTSLGTWCIHYRDAIANDLPRTVHTNTHTRLPDLANV